MKILVHRDTDVDMCKDEIIYGLKTLRTSLKDGPDEYTISVVTSLRDTLTGTSKNIGRFLIHKRNGDIFSFRVPYGKYHMYMFTDFRYGRNIYGCNIVYIDTVIPELNELCEIVVTVHPFFTGRNYDLYNVNLDDNTITKVDNANEDL